MRKICIINQKGGVGKTTTTVSLAAGLSRKNRRVLVLDFDPQGNIATCIDAPNTDGMHDFLLGQIPFKCITPMGTNLDLITSRENLHKAEMIITKKDRPVDYILERLRKIEETYDYILIDCPPSLGIMNQAALLFADEAIIPISTEYLGLDALKKMIKAIDTLNDHYMHDLEISNIIPTMYDKRIKESMRILDQLNAEYYGIVTNPVHLCSKLKEAPKYKKSIFSHAPSSQGAKDYAQVVRYILQDEEIENTTAEAKMLSQISA